MREYAFGSGRHGAINLSSYTQTWISCSGTSGASSLSATGTFAAGDIIFIHQSRGGSNVGKGEFNTVASYTTGTITLVSPLENTYTDSGSEQAQVAVVKEASSVTGSYTVPAWDGNVGGAFVMLCNGTFSGTVNATGRGYRGGAGGVATAGLRKGTQGESTTGTGTISTSALSIGGGGGGGADTANPTGDTGGGAGGSYGSQGENGKLGGPPPDGGVPGSAGSTYGSATLTQIFFGSGGGGGCADDSGSAGAGGAGGGFVVVYAKAVAGTISSNGSVGGNAQVGTQSCSGGGGGAGGSILIKSVLTSGATITATSGAGGTATGGFNNEYGGNGGAGGVGRIRIESCSLSGTTSPAASTQTGGHAYCGTNIAIL